MVASLLWTQRLTLGTDRAMRIYLSGWQASNAKRELAVIRAGAMKYRCFSFASTVKIPGFPYHLPHIEGSVQACIKNGIGIMMDSGVVGFRTYKTSLKKAGKDLSKIPTD